MKKNLFTGTLAAVFVLSFLAAASGNEQHAAAEASSASNAGNKVSHVRVWKKMTSTEGTGEKQVHQQAAAVKAPEAAKPPEKVVPPEVLHKIKPAAAKVEAGKIKELQAKLTKAESFVSALQKKLSLAEQHALDTKKLQAKLAKAESSIHMLQKQSSLAGQQDQGVKELQAKLTKAESSVSALQKKLSLAEQHAQDTKKLQAKLAKAESSIHMLQKQSSLAGQQDQGVKELQAKLTKAESSVSALQKKLSLAEQHALDTKKLQAKLANAESAIHDLNGKLEASALSIRNLRDQAAAAEASAVQAGASLDCESLRAQIIGLERIIGEKDAALKKIGKERDHWEINKNILLTKITRQRADLEKLQEENSALLRDFAAKEKECAEATGSIPAVIPQQ